MTRTSLLLTCSIACLLPLSSFAQKTAPPPRRPKLVVMIVADQLRADALHRYADNFGPGGFSRLLKQGASTVGHYGQQNTYTGPGHAVIATGAYGYLNGIMQNKWLNRAAGRSESMVFDPKAIMLDDDKANPEEDSSPVNLVGSTVGDELRLSSPQSRVIAIALKGRGSVLLGGHLGHAYFFSEKTGAMTSSSYYMADLPTWAKTWNARKPADTWFGKSWQRLLPANAYLDVDDASWEGDLKGLGRTFPHPLTGKLTKPGPDYYEALALTPLGIDLETDFALAALDGEQLGRRGVTDILAVSYSSTDLVGHTYGPLSQEYQDTVVHLDRQLAKLLSELDRRFKPGEVLVMFTADHGAVPVPEQMAQIKIAAARIKKALIKATINRILGERLGIQGNWVAALEDPSVYLDQKLIAQNKLDPARVEEEAGRAALTIPGMLGYHTRTQLMNGWLPPTEAARAVARSFFPPRSGDLVLVTEPFYFWGKYGEKDTGSTHGSFYRYDTDVPVVFVGPWFTAGQHPMIEMVDVAATLAHVLNLTPPANCEGRPAAALLRR